MSAVLGVDIVAVGAKGIFTEVALNGARFNQYHLDAAALQFHTQCIGQRFQRKLAGVIGAAVG